VLRADLTNNIARQSAFGELFDTLMTPSAGYSYQTYVAKDKKLCLKSADSGTVLSSSVIPDPSQFRFVGSGPCPKPAVSGGSRVIQVAPGRFEKTTPAADVRRYRARVGDSLCNRYEDNYMEGDYLFARVEYVTTTTGVPMQVTWQGHNNQTGSHRDMYVYDVLDFSPTVNQTALQPPADCPEAPSASASIGSLGERAPAGDDARRALARLSRPGSEHRLAHEIRDFMLTHGKSYASSEERLRRAKILAENTAMIELHNTDPSKTYKMKVNALADHSAEEYRKSRCGCHRGADPALIAKAHLKQQHYLAAAELPSYVDWREQGVVTRIKDQAWCGSCWAEAAMEALETAQARASGTFTELAPQLLVDCAWPNNTANGNGGCGGSDAIVAWQWLLDNLGGKAATEASYPYTATDGYCMAQSSWASGATLTGYTTCPQGDFTCAKTLISKYGSAAIAIDASHPSFGFYSHGTYYEPACGNTLNDLDHAVLAIGYGTDENGEDYLLVQNSWSQLWAGGSLNSGLDSGGVIRMSVKDNNCGVLTELAVPHV
jgi:cathepsin L